MRTRKQIETSRLNGAKSQGPATPAGKQRSSRNAFKHGLLSDSIVAPDEDPQAFHTLMRELEDQCRPAGRLQHMFVEMMGVSYWRLRRTFAQLSETCDPAELDLLYRYETRFQRTLQRSLYCFAKASALPGPGPQSDTLPNEPEPNLTPPESISSGPDPSPLPLAGTRAPLGASAPLSCDPSGESGLASPPGALPSRALLSAGAIPAAGHHGMDSVIQALGGSEIARVRLGIHPGRPIAADAVRSRIAEGVAKA